MFDLNFLPLTLNYSLDLGPMIVIINIHQYTNNKTNSYQLYVTIMKHFYEMTSMSKLSYRRSIKPKYFGTDGRVDGRTDARTE